MSIAELIGVSEGAMQKADGKSVATTKNQGRVYLLKIEVPDTKEIIWKVGKASGRSSLDRFMTIMRSWYLSYRVLPRAKIKRDRKSKNALKDEAAIHNLLKIYKYEPSERVDGYSELFKCDEETVLEMYHQVIA